MKGSMDWEVGEDLLQSFLGAGRSRSTGSHAAARQEEGSLHLPLCQIRGASADEGLDAHLVVELKKHLALSESLVGVVEVVAFDLLDGKRLAIGLASPLRRMG